MDGVTRGLGLGSWRGFLFRLIAGGPFPRAREARGVICQVAYFTPPRMGHLVTEPTSAPSNKTQETNA